MKNIEKKEKRLNLRLTQREYNLFLKEYNASHYNKQSQFLRVKLFRKTELIEDLKIQNKALLTAGETNTVLIKLGANINQLVKGMHTYKNTNLSPSEKDAILQTKNLLQDLMNIYNNLLID